VRRLLALVLTEVEHHGLAVFGAWGVTAAALVVGLGMQLIENAVTLMSVAHGVVAGLMPILALFLAGRFVVADHTAGTHEFLSALPVSPTLRTLVRWALSWAALLAPTLGTILATALVASRREGVPASFLLVLGVTLGAYATAWHSVAFAVAHTGRFRWLVWWLAFVAVVSLPTRTPWLWLALVADGADRIRLAPPWALVPVAMAWAAGGLGFAVFVGSWRGGALVEGWFRPATQATRGKLVAVGLTAMVVESMIEDSLPQDDGWGLLAPAHESGRVVVRAAASPGTPLEALARRVGGELDALGAELGVARWPGVVLLRHRPEPTEPPVAQARGSGPADDNVVVLVDPGLPPDVAAERVLAVVLGHAMAGAPDADPDARFVAEGLARWWVVGGDPSDGPLAAVAAGQTGLDHHALHGAVGPEVAAAAAGEGFAALEEVAGREAPLQLGRALLTGRWPGHAWPAARASWARTGPGWVGGLTGADEAAWRAAWEARLASVEPLWMPEAPALEVVTTDGEVRVQWAGEWPTGAVVEWLALDPLHAAPVPGDEVERATPLPGATSLAVPADPRRPVVARVVVVAEGAGRVALGWTTRGDR
jgi:hypothetical protein